MHVEVAVVGAGMAGIAAALEVKAAGRSVALVDPAPGGLIKTVDGLEVGPQSLLGSSDDVWWVLEQLQLVNDVVPVPKGLPRYLVRDDTLRALEPSPLSLLTTDALTWGDRAHLLRELIQPRHGKAFENESVETFLTRHFGASLTEHVGATALSGVFATPIQALEAAAAIPRLVEAEEHSGSVLRGLLKQARTSGSRSSPAKRPGSFRLRHGFDSIAGAATSTLTHFEARAQALRRAGNRWCVIDGLSADAVVVAVSPNALSQVLGASHQTPSFEQVPMLVAHFHEGTAGQTRLPRGFGYLVNPNEPKPYFARGVVFTGSIDAQRQGHFCAFIGGYRRDDVLTLDDQHIRAGIEGDVRRLTGGSIGELLHVQRWSRGFAPPLLGHSKRVNAVREAGKGLGVHIAGAYLGSGTVRDAARFGREAGRAAVAELAQAAQLVAA